MKTHVDYEEFSKSLSDWLVAVHPCQSYNMELLFQILSWFPGYLRPIFLYCGQASEMTKRPMRCSKYHTFMTFESTFPAECHQDNAVCSTEIAHSGTFLTQTIPCYMIHVGLQKFANLASDWLAESCQPIRSKDYKFLSTNIDFQQIFKTSFWLAATVC